MRVLLSLVCSHYCEKARWALDLSPLRHAYVEDNHCPLLHYKPAMRASKASQLSYNVHACMHDDPLSVRRSAQGGLADQAEYRPACLLAC